MKWRKIGEVKFKFRNEKSPIKAEIVLHTIRFKKDKWGGWVWEKRLNPVFRMWFKIPRKVINDPFFSLHLLTRALRETTNFITRWSLDASWKGFEVEMRRSLTVGWERIEEALRNLEEKPITFITFSMEFKFDWNKIMEVKRLYVLERLKNE